MQEDIEKLAAGFAAQLKLTKDAEDRQLAELRNTTKPQIEELVAFARQCAEGAARVLDEQVECEIGPGVADLRDHSITFSIDIRQNGIQLKSLSTQVSNIDVTLDGKKYKRLEIKAVYSHLYNEIMDALVSTYRFIDVG